MQRFTIYLLNNKVIEFEDAISDIKRLKPVKLSEGYEDKIAFYYTYNQSKKPKWHNFLKDALAEDILKQESYSHAALLLVKASNRIFAFTFGYGRNLLDLSKIEYRFGLKVVLNRIDSDKIRSLNTKFQDDVVISSNTQASKQTKFSQFGLDQMRLILRGISGKGTTAGFEHTMTGANSLVISRDLEIDQIESFCKELYEAYHDDAYKKDFGWIDNLEFVEDEKLVSQLNDSLLKEITTTLSEKTYLAVPEPILWEDIDGFIIQGTGKIVYDDLDFNIYLDALGQEKRSILTIDLLKKRYVKVTYTASGQSHGKWTLYNCIVSEQMIEGSLYVLNEGRWLRIEEKFAHSINKAFNDINLSSLRLPARQDGETEASYNERVATSDPDYFLNLDKILFKPSEAESSIEFCDLLSINGEMIHVKRRSSSSMLSHLFSQGSVSAQILLNDSLFRDNLRKKINSLTSKRASEFASLFSEENVKKDNRKLTVIYAIIPSSNKSGRGSIPFFSRLNLVMFAKTIQGMGLKVELLIVQ